MPFIQFPAVPYYPGVPELLRPVQETVAASPVLAIGIGTLENILGSALQQGPRWGIFDQNNNQLGISSEGQSVPDAFLSQLTGSVPPTLSTVCLEYIKETRISDFPVEGGGFADYNKAEMPANPVVTLALAGTEDDRTRFLEAIEAACISTDLFNVVTPEYNYIGYAIERFRYSRRAERGATLLVVEISLKEIRSVTAVLSTAIVQPQNAAATPSANNGITQTTPPDVSTLKSFINHLSNYAGGN